MSVFVRSWPEVLRLLLKLFVLAPVIVAFGVQLHRYHSPQYDEQTTRILVATFGATALLGSASVLFQFVLRRRGHTVTVVFYGVVALLMVVNIVSEFLDSRFSADLRDDYFYMLLYLAISLGGIRLESYRLRRSLGIHATS